MTVTFLRAGRDPPWTGCYEPDAPRTHGRSTSWHGLSIDSVEDGVATATIPYDEKLTNPFSVVNGGVIAALVDAASGAVLRATFGDPDAGYLATVELDLKYLQPATGLLAAEVRAVHAGSTIGVTEATVTAPAEHGPAALGSTVYRLFRA